MPTHAQRIPPRDRSEAAGDRPLRRCERRGAPGRYASLWPGAQAQVPATPPPHLNVARSQPQRQRAGRSTSLRSNPAVVAPARPIVSRLLPLRGRTGRYWLSRPPAQAPPTGGTLQPIVARLKPRPGRPGRWAVFVPPSSAQVVSTFARPPRLAIAWPRYRIRRAGLWYCPQPQGYVNDLLEALLVYLKQNSSVLAVIPHESIQSDQTEPGQTFPYLICEEVTTGETGYQTADDTGTIPYDDNQSIRVSVFGTGKATTRALARKVDAAINDVVVFFAWGTELVLRRNATPVDELDEERSVGGIDVWRRVMVYEAIVARLVN
jgi:hypothetical protein